MLQAGEKVKMEVNIAVEWQDAGGTALATGVVMDRGKPVAVSLGGAQAAPGGPLSRGGGESVSVPRSVPAAAAAPAAAPAAPQTEAPAPTQRAQAWPRIDAPACQPALQPFDVTVGFALDQQAGVTGGPVVLPHAPETKTLDLTVELAAGEGVQALDGWSRTLTVQVDNLAASQVTFRLVGTEPTNSEHAWLTTLEVRYVLAGTVCGTASRPLIIVPAGSAAAPQERPYGVGWQATVAAASPLVLAADEHAPDLTIEISKPDRNASSGHYVCQLLSPHALSVERGPFGVDLGQDAKTFAKAMVEEIRLFSTSELLEGTIESIGRLVAERLPSQVFDALREVAAKVAPAVPALLIVSAEPYVPWELAWMDLPLDAARPSHLGAQALVGRWLRDDASASSPQAAAAGIVPRPAVHPIAELSVRNMVVMAAWYQAQSGLRRLPKAEDEAKLLAQQYAGVPLAASAPSLRQLL